MNEKQAHNIVVTLAFALWAITAIITVLTLKALADWNFFSVEGQLLSGVLSIAIINLALVLVFGIAIGWGLMKRKNWARLLAVVFCILVIVDIVIYIFAHPLSFGLLLVILGAGVVIWLLAAKQEVKALFRR